MSGWNITHWGDLETGKNYGGVLQQGCTLYKKCNFHSLWCILTLNKLAHFLKLNSFSPTPLLRNWTFAIYSPLGWKVITNNICIQKKIIKNCWWGILFSNSNLDILNVFTEFPRHSYLSTVACELLVRALNGAAPPQAHWWSQQRAGCSGGGNTPEDLEENM